MRRLKRYIAGCTAVFLVVSGFPCTGLARVKAEDSHDQVKQAVAVSDEETLDKDYEWLTFEQIKEDNKDAEHVASNLSLPVTGNYGSKIFWSTSDSSGILNSGVVMSGSVQKNVTLTARIISGTVEKEKQFPVTVLSGDTDQKPLHILQVGDSNTEFARITQGMNEVLKETYGDYGDGFLTLAKDFIGTGTIRPEHFDIAYSGTWTQHDLGGSDVYNSPFGIYMDTMEQGAAVTVTFAGSAVDLYYLSMGHSGKFRVVIDNVDKGIVDQSNPEGQMIVKKAVFEDLEYGQHTMVLTNTDGGHVNFYGADYRVDDAVIRKNISTWGNGGIQAYEYANSLSSEIFGQTMSELDPDVVAILIGTNDNGGSRTPEVFGDSLTTMIQRTKKAVPDAEIWVISTFETLNPTEGLQRYWDRVFPETAAKEGVHYWAMGEWFGPYSADYMEDPWHCDRAGGRKIAEKMHEVILGGKDVSGRTVDSACENEAIQAKTGTSFTELELPGRIPVILNDLQKSVVTTDVEWSSDGFEKDKKGTYTLKGKILNDSEQRIYNPENVEASIQIQVTDDYQKKAEKGLRLHYDFSGIQGDTVKDLAGGYDGTIKGNVTVVEGVAGDAAYFPKDAGSYVDIPKEAFAYSKDVTISAWVKLEEINTWTTMLGGGSDTTNYFQLVASGVPSTGACGLSAGIKETKGKEYRVNAASDDKPVPGEWCMVTYTQKGSIGKLYLDGKLVAESSAVRRTIKDVVSAENAKVCLGATPVWPDPATKGAIDEFKVFDYAMTEEEVKASGDIQVELPDLVITNEKELQEFSDSVARGNNFHGRKVLLDQDIDMKGIPFTAIGSMDHPFKGEFDGQGHTVSNLVVSSENWHQGLFGLMNDGIIQNVNLENAKISGTSWVGGIAGYSSGVIRNCTVSGTITGISVVGGIAGDQYGEVANCMNSATVNAAEQIAGGIAGYMGGTDPKIIDCQNSGTVNGSRETGGIVGTLTSGKLSKIYNIGKINGAAQTSSAGGLSGTMTGGFIVNGYNRGAVSGGAEAGGIAGRIDGNVSVTQCYNAGTVECAACAGGLVGRNNAGGLSKSYYDKEVCGAKDIGENMNVPNGSGYGKTTVEMKRSDTYKGFPFGSVWKIDDKVNDGYPTLCETPAAQQDQLQQDYEWLTFDKIKGENADPEHITTFLKLPTEGGCGSKIYWSTSDSSALLNSGVVIPDSKKKKDVKLTARFVSGGQEEKKTFALTILPNEADERPMHVLQIGDSNTELGRISQGLGSRLREEYGDYSEGFLTFQKNKIWTWPDDYEIAFNGTWIEENMFINVTAKDAPFGMVSTSETAGASLKVQFVGSAADIYYLSSKQTGRFRVLIDGEDKGIINSGKSDGNAEAKKVKYNDLEYGIHTIEMVNVSGYVALYGADFQIDDAVERKNISTWGLGGIQAYQYANILNGEIFEQCLKELNPDVVTLLIGTNDNGGDARAKLPESLTTMIQRVKRSLPDAEIWVLSTFETVNSSDGLQWFWDSAFPETVAKEKVHYWSMGEWFGPYSSEYMMDTHHCDLEAGFQVAEKLYEVILGGKDAAGRTIGSACENEAIQAKTGTSFTELELPGRIPVILDDLQKSVVTADVEWSSDGFESDKTGTYTLKGKILDDPQQRIYNSDHVQAVIQIQVTDDYQKAAEKGLRLHYDFSEIQGTTVKDLAGGHDGTIKGNVTVVEGVEGEAAYFPKDAGSYVDIPKEVFEHSSDLTVSMWMKLEEINTWTTMLGGGSDTTNYFQLVASGIPSTGACGLSAGIKETKGKEYRVNAASEDKPVLNEWCMVTYTQKGGIGKLYLDGEVKATSNAVRRTIKDVVSAENAKVCLGATPVWPDPATKGAIDEFKVYDYAMTAQEVKEQRYPDKTVISIEATKVPEKTEYMAGEKLDLTGMVITGRCADGTEVDLTDECKVTGYDPEKIGRQTITVTYKDISVAFTVTVVKKENPNKPVYEIFNDISKEDWYAENVQYVYDKKIMKGMTDTIFGSNTILTRSHFATILYRMEGEPKVEYAERFQDVPDGEFYTSPVIWASSKDVGVISGYEDGNFGPNDSITREQMAVMLYRYAKFKKYDTSDTDGLKGFEDKDKVSPFADEAMKWAVGAGLISGNADGTLAPQGNTSRAVCATIIKRFLEGYGK